MSRAGFVLGLVLAATVIVGDAGAQETDPYPDSAVDPTASANGCGPAGYGWTIPDLGFTSACDWHDRCYGTLGLPRGYCDDGMYDRAKRICETRSPATYADCVHTATLYYLAVSKFGESPYQAGQEEARLRDQERKYGRFHGDPHLVTFDGLRYSYQVAGVYEMIRDARSGVSIMQAQFYPTSDTFTVTTGVAVKVGDVVVAVQYDPSTDVRRVFVDGVAVTDDHVALPSGFVRFGNELEGTNGIVQVRSWEGLAVDVIGVGSRFDVNMALPSSMAGAVEGLLGNADGDPANDLFAGGSVVAEAEVYEDAFRAEWKLSADDSYFVAGGIDYHSAEFAAYPVVRLDFDNFDAAEVDAATIDCEEAGVGPEDLRSCVFDVLASGDPHAANLAAASGRYAERTRDPASVRLVPDPALVIAAAQGDADEVRRLLDEGVDPNVGRLSDRATPLVFAAQDGHTEVVRILLDAGASADLQVEGGLTGLMLAAQNGHSDVVDLLLGAGAYADGRASEGFSALYLASQNGHASIVSALLDHVEDVESPQGDISSLYIASQNGHLEVATALLNAAASPDGVSSEFRPLIVAAQNGHVDVVSRLIEGGVEVDGTTPDGDTALGRAAQVGEIGVVERLLRAGANPTIRLGDLSPLDRAARNGRVAVIEALLEAGVDPNDHGPDPALLLAVFSESEESVRLLIEAGADPDAAGDDLFTPIMVAAQDGLASIAAVLIEAGADVNLAGDRGWTALHAAANRDRLDLVRQLLAAGADPAAQTSDGAVPADFASDPSVIAALGG